MKQLTGIEILEVRWVPTEGVWTVWFEVAYPGETYCRSEVRLFPSAVGEGDGGIEGKREGLLENRVARVARDHLVTVLQEEGRPVSVVIGVDAGGREVLERSFPT